MLITHVKRFVLSPLPPSKNELRYIDTTGRRRFESGKPRYVFQSDKYRQWANHVWPLIPRFEIAATSYLRLDMVFSYPFFYKNGKLRIFDAPNMQEALQDTICKRIGINDARVKAWTGDSADSKEEFVTVTLTELPQDVQLDT